MNGMSTVSFEIGFVNFVTSCLKTLLPKLRPQSPVRAGANVAAGA